MIPHEFETFIAEATRFFCKNLSLSFLAQNPDLRWSKEKTGGGRARQLAPEIIQLGDVSLSGYSKTSLMPDVAIRSCLTAQLVRHFGGDYAPEFAVKLSDDSNLDAAAGLVSCSYDQVLQRHLASKSELNEAIGKRIPESNARQLIALLAVAPADAGSFKNWAGCADGAQPIYVFDADGFYDEPSPLPLFPVPFKAASFSRVQSHEALKTLGETTNKEALQSAISIVQETAGNASGIEQLFEDTKRLLASDLHGAEQVLLEYRAALDEHIRRIPANLADLLAPDGQGLGRWLSREQFEDAVSLRRQQNELFNGFPELAY